jgi:ferredoxin
MTFVVCEPCIKCKYTDCVDVCPVTCFHEGETMLAIDPAECIDCGVCVDECPVHAIYPGDEVPEKWRNYIELNARYAHEWPVIEEGQDPLPTAEEFKDRESKGGHFSPNPAPRE